jgi:hypothetical protein
VTQFIKDTWPPVRAKRPDKQSKPINSVGIGTVLPERADEAADRNTIKMLHKVLDLRAQLRALEPQLSKAITEFGSRRGWSGYREFHLRNELNAQIYTETNNVR